MSSWLIQMIEQGGYIAIALLMCLENVFPPIPSEVIMGLGGIEAGQGNLSFLGVIVAGTLGSTAGNVFWFWVGRRLGPQRLAAFVVQWGRWLTLDQAEVDRLDRFFKRHGNIAVLIARVIPTIRTLISLPAGLFHMRWGPFLLWTALGTTAWNVALGGMGYWLGRSVEDIDTFTGPASVAVLALIALATVWRMIVWRPSGHS